MAERILLVDDHPLTRSALAGLLGQHGFDVVGEASDGEEAIESAERLRPDLVLLDLSMPGVDGLTALPRLREAAPDCEVVVLTASGTEENLLGAIRGGAAGYLLKSEPPERIVDFLRGVAQGEAALSGTVARRLLEQVRAGGGRSSGVPDAIAVALSARERPTRSQSASTSPSTRFAPTSRASCASSESPHAARPSRLSRTHAAESPSLGDSAPSTRARTRSFELPILGTGLKERSKWASWRTNHPLWRTMLTAGSAGRHASRPKPSSAALTNCGRVARL